MSVDKIPEEQPEGAAEHIEGILRTDAEMRDGIARAEQERARVKGKTPTVLIASLGVLLVALTAWNVSSLGSDAEVFPIERQQAGGEFTVYITASAIEEYRDSLDRLPLTLEEIGMDDEDVAYSVMGDRYVVEVIAGGATFVYTSGEDLAPYLAAFERATEGTEQ